MKPVVIGLILLGLIRHYFWELVPPQAQAHTWNITGSIVIVIFLSAMVSRATLPVIVWWIAEEAQVSLCSLGRLFSNWTVKPGEAQCSALLGFDLSTAGILCVGLLLLSQYVRSYRSQKKENQP